MSNPLVTAHNPSFNNNYSTYQPGFIYPNNLDVIKWPEGYGYDLTTAGPGFLMNVTAAQINGDTGNSGTIDGLDFLSFWCSPPLMLPYKNARNIYFSWSDNSWNDSSAEIVITGVNWAGKVVTETISCPAATDVGALTTNQYQYITSMKGSQASVVDPLTANLFVDLGYTGKTLPFMPDGKCSSWSASLQVSVDSANIEYDVFNDNFPRNVQTNQTPSSASSWFPDTIAAYPDTFPMLDYTFVPVGGHLYPALTSQTTSLLKPVPFPVANIYLSIKNATTTGSLVAIFLQDSIWFK